MISVNYRAGPIRVGATSIALSLALGLVSASVARLRTQDQKTTGTPESSRRMADGKQWTTLNLDVKTVPSYCYDDAELNCRRYGRLYTWESAQQGCKLLGDGWRLPTNDEWRQLAEHYGGLLEESQEKGKLTFKALIVGGSSGFNALLGGGRSLDGRYARIEAHGFYWTASERGEAAAWFYNFGKGMQALGRLSDGEKQRGFSVRCIRE
jgi:uncharacterized protein (TIGR02145 family)